MPTSSPKVTVHPDHEALSQAAAQRLMADVSDVLEDQDECALALAGGGTPRPLYTLLADADVPWNRMRLFWGDERMVPHDHPKSNVRMARETLLSNTAVPADHVHPMPVEDAPEQAANRYERRLRRYFDDYPPSFDLVLLGLGADGHTASLFPEDPPSLDDSAWVRAVTAPDRHDIRQRLTCTLSVLNDARRAYFLVSGERKRDAVRKVLVARDEALPATHVSPREQLVWFLDRDAADGL